jgi:hypothetical protein
MLCDTDSSPWLSSCASLHVQIVFASRLYSDDEERKKKFKVCCSYSISENMKNRLVMNDWILSKLPLPYTRATENFQLNKKRLGSIE